MGFLYLQNRDLELAEKNLLKSIELGSKDLGNMNLGHVYLAKKETKKALECYKKSINNFSNKEEFLKGFDDDYQYLEQYGLNKKTHEKIRKKIMAF